jgi:hypothetical protein
MAIGLTSLGSIGGSTGTTLALTGVTVPAGSVVVVSVNDSSTTGVGGALADGGINTYTRAAALTNNNQNPNGFTAAWEAWNTAALSSATITYTRVQSGRPTGMSAFYATGADTSASPLDVTATAYGSSANPSVTGGVPAVANELVVGIVGWPGNTSDAYTQDTTHGLARHAMAYVQVNAVRVARIGRALRLLAAGDDFDLGVVAHGLPSIEIFAQRFGFLRRRRREDATHVIAGHSLGNNERPTIAIAQGRARQGTGSAANAAVRQRDCPWAFTGKNVSELFTDVWHPLRKVPL